MASSSSNVVKNLKASVRIEAHDAGGAILSIFEDRTSLDPPIILLEFMSQAKKEYPKVVKYVMTIAYVLILSLNLSSGPAGASNERLVVNTSAAIGYANRPTVPHHTHPRVVRKDFTEPKAAVPYEYIWNNSINQTAQQYVALLSLLEDERRSRLNLVEEEARRIVERRKKFAEKEVRVVHPPFIADREPEEEKPQSYWRTAIVAALGFLALLLTAITLHTRFKKKTAVGWAK